MLISETKQNLSTVHGLSAVTPTLLDTTVLPTFTFQLKYSFSIIVLTDSEFKATLAYKFLRDLQSYLYSIEPKLVTDPDSISYIQKEKVAQFMGGYMNGGGGQKQGKDKVFLAQ